MSKLSNAEKLVSKAMGGGDYFTAHRTAAEIEGLSSGLLTLNLALSGTPSVGFAYGRIVELFGPEQSGKTTLAFTLIKQAQEAGLISAFLDAEHALDKKYAGSIFDIHNVSIAQPECGEDAINMAKAMLDQGYRLIVIDSVAALTPKSELQGEAGDAHIGRLARLMAQGVRTLTPRASSARAIVVFINQMRANISSYGAGETTTGGVSLKYFSSYRVDIRSRRSEKIVTNGAEVGIHSEIKVVKNKLFMPHRKAKAKILYGAGFDSTFDLLAYLFRKKGTTKVSIGGKEYTRKGLALKLVRNDALRDNLIAKVMS